MSIRLSELIRNYPCEIHGSADPVLTEVEYDSRRTVAGNLFFCMPASVQAYLFRIYASFHLFILFSLRIRWIQLRYHPSGCRYSVHPSQDSRQV